MPISSICKSDTSVSYCIWQITETEAFFWQNVTLLPEDAASIRALKLPVRRLERLACRAALATLLPRPVTEVTYSPDGAPQTAGFHLSFSHCKNFAAAAIAPFPVGIDVEQISERILKLHPKFVNESEQAIFDVNDQKQMYLCWGAKEAIYKCIRHAPYNFLQDMRLEKTPSENLLKGFAKTTEGEIVTDIKYLQHDDLMLVVCTQ